MSSTRSTIRRTAPFLTVAIAAALLPVSGAFASAPQVDPASARTSSACADDTGVTVVVDFTDLGGEVVSGCASDGVETGRDALVAAGFEPTDSQPGLICAIDSMPDPCPETFDGSFWSYWHEGDDGEWVSYQVGADTSAPEPGRAEGWRYNDGSAGPSVSPSAAATSATPEGDDAQAADDGPASESESASDWAVAPLFFAIAAGIALLVVAGLIVLTVLVLRARSRRAEALDN